MFMMYPHYYYGSMFPFGGLFWFLIVLGVIFLIWAIFRGHHDESTYEDDMKDEDTALEILKKRYAKGEITKKEFLEMKKDIS